MLRAARCGGLRRSAAARGSYAVPAPRRVLCSQHSTDARADGPPAEQGGAAAAGTSSSFWEDPYLRRNVSVLVGSQTLLNIGVSQVVPVLPIFAQEMGLGATGIGVLIAAPAVARLALNIPLGKLCDTVGRKPLMRYGTLVTATGCVGTGAAMGAGLPFVLGFRMLVGAGSAASMTGSGAMMADLTDRAPQHRAKIMGFQTMVLSGVWVVGPVLGGLLCEAWGPQNR